MAQEAGTDDFEEFLELRRHIRRLQAGTPLLLRTLSGGQEELQICTFWVSQDLQRLRWREQEGEGASREVPIEAVIEIVQEAAPARARSQEEGHFALNVRLRPAGLPPNTPAVLGLICASAEDLDSWREGLKFLVGPKDAAAPPPPAPPRAQETPTGSVLVTERLRRSESRCEELERENKKLREIVKVKDNLIAELMRDAEGRSAERCNKTESSSRESDDHLMYREAAMLRRKNKKLQQALKAKQQTVAELLQLLGRVTQQQGAESSAVEVDEEDEEEDEEEPPQPVPDLNTSRRPGTAPPATRSQVPASAPKPQQRVSPKAQASRPAPTPAPVQAEAEEEESDQEAFFAEMQELAGKLEQLERDVGGLLPFQPPPRGAAPAAANSQPSSSASPSGARGAAGAQVSAAGPPGVAGAQLAELLMKAMGGLGTAPPQPPAAAGGSATALEALARELALLEDKKRVVERLARSLEPESDGEDDGFPLR